MQHLCVSKKQTKQNKNKKKWPSEPRERHTWLSYVQADRKTSHTYENYFQTCHWIHKNASYFTMRYGICNLFMGHSTRLKCFQKRTSKRHLIFKSTRLKRRNVQHSEHPFIRTILVYKMLYTGSFFVVFLFRDQN